MGKATPSPTPSKNEGPPPDVVPLFMATKSQEIFECICDNHVTEENPHKIIKKEDIIVDMRMRAAISDFHPVKQIVQDYPGEELLIVYDPDFKFGQNFFLCITEEAKNRFLAPVEEEEEKTKSGAAEEQEVQEEEEIPVYVPPVSKDWIDQGSAAEISCEIVEDNRPKIRYRASRVRKEFGAPFCFSDRDVDPIASLEQGLSASYLACKPYEDANFVIKKVELELAVQAVPEKIDGFSQTDWKHPINASLQYNSRGISANESKQIQKNEDFLNFVTEAAPRFELAIQQNLIMDVFFDDWTVLGEDDANFGSKSDSHMKEYQSFTDLEYSKDKSISFIDWHPQVKGVMGVACCERYTFDERIDNANKLLMTPSLVLIWSFTDPIHPQLLLEGPDDITCFKFCPTNPNIIAGGCINGQLVLWDISEHDDRINSTKGSGTNPNQKKTAMFGEEVQPDIPNVRYCAVSSIEGSHRSLITSLDWIPNHFEFNRLGAPVENRNCECIQIITCGADGNVMVWDIRVPKVTAPPNAKEQKTLALLGNKNPFKHLDLTWKPLLKLSMTKTDSSGDYSPMKFSIPERQGVRDHVPAPTAPKQEPTPGGVAKIPSAKNQKILDNISTKFFIGTEDGEVVHCDFKLEKDNETGKLNVNKPNWSAVPHDGPVCSLQRSPFFPDLLLSVGGWNFTLWREINLGTPILQSECASKTYTAAHWSLTRPAVFFLCTKSGNVEVWDLLDRTHEPILKQNVTADPITHIVPYIVSRKQHLIGVADSVGTLHILEIPWNLRQPAPNEEQAVRTYLDRETKRIEHFFQHVPANLTSKTTGATDKKEKEKSSAPAIPGKNEISEAFLEECKEKYEDYLKLELKLLQELGLVEVQEAEA